MNTATLGIAARVCLTGTLNMVMLILLCTALQMNIHIKWIQKLHHMCVPHVGKEEVPHPFKLLCLLPHKGVVCMCNNLDFQSGVMKSSK